MSCWYEFADRRPFQTSLPMYPHQALQGMPVARQVQPAEGIPVATGVPLDPRSRSSTYVV